MSLDLHIKSKTPILKLNQKHQSLNMEQVCMLEKRGVPVS